MSINTFYTTGFKSFKYSFQYLLTLIMLMIYYMSLNQSFLNFKGIFGTLLPTLQQT